MPSPAITHLKHSLRQLLGTLASIAETRLNVLATDLQEVHARLVVLVLVTAFAVLSFAMAAGLAVLLVVAMFWDTHRLISIAGLMGVFAVAGALLWRATKQRTRETRELFAGTRTELRRDGEQLRSGRPAA